MDIIQHLRVAGIQRSVCGHRPGHNAKLRQSSAKGRESLGEDRARHLSGGNQDRQDRAIVAWRGQPAGDDLVDRCLVALHQAVDLRIDIEDRHLRGQHHAQLGRPHLIDVDQPHLDHHLRLAVEQLFERGIQRLHPVLRRAHRQDPLVGCATATGASKTFFATLVISVISVVVTPGT